MNSQPSSTDSSTISRNEEDESSEEEVSRVAVWLTKSRESCG